MMTQDKKTKGLTKSEMEVMNALWDAPRALTVHEFEADSAVLQQGIDAKTYQLLLVTKAVGNRLQTLGNNLSHHSLKKRIKMMHKKSSNRWLMTKAVVLPALMALAVVAFATPKTETATLPEGTSIQNELTAPVASNANDDIITGVPEKLPEFPGGVEALYKWLMDNLQYPKECMEQGIQGRVLVHFIVKKDGSITDVQAVRSPHEKLSEEAVRIVKMMPKWTPGKQNGKPVQSEFNLPIFFKLNADQPKTK